MTEEKLSPADAALRERITELSVHISCGGIRGPLQQPSAAYPNLPVKWQSCRHEESAQRWAGHDISREYDLCIVCCRATAGGSTRWSWLACENCRTLNHELGETGIGALPIGRHSIMNGHAIGGGAKIEEQAARMAQYVERQRRLRTWRDREYGRLASDFDADVDVPLRLWQVHWPPSLDASRDAFARLLRWLSSTQDTQD